MGYSSSPAASGSPWMPVILTKNSNAPPPSGDTELSAEKKVWNLT